MANFEDCVNFAGPRKERPEGIYFSHDAAHSPDINRGAIVGRPQEHFWGPVPAGTKGTASYCFYCQNNVISSQGDFIYFYVISGLILCGFAKKADITLLLISHKILY